MNEIFEKQKEFQKLLNNDITTQEFKNAMFLGLFEECVELMKETPHKKHRINQVFNKENFEKELVDVFIYLINLCISVDIDFEKLKDLIKQKQEINFERIRGGY